MKPTVSPTSVHFSPVTGIDNRLRVLGFYDIEKLRQIIAWAGTENVVRLAAERRLRDLQKKRAVGTADKFENLRAGLDQPVSTMTTNQNHHHENAHTQTHRPLFP